MAKSLWERFTWLDPRSLVAWRVILAITILADLFISRFWYVEFFLTDTGVFPRRLLADHVGFSLFFASGSAIWAYFLLGVMVIAALFLLFGFYTRTAMVLSYVLMLSLHWRIEFTLGGPDRLLLLVMMWSMFLPLGRFGSIDAYHRTGRFFPDVKRGYRPFERWAVLGMILLVSALYGVAAYVKLESDAWYKEFSTIYYVLQTGYHVTPFGYLFRDNLAFTKILSILTLAIEWTLGFSLLASLFGRGFRSLFSVLAIVLAIGMGSMLFIGHFPILGVGFGFLFMPTRLWNRLPVWQDGLNFARRLWVLLSKHTKQFSRQFVYRPWYSSAITGFLVFSICLHVVANIDEITGWSMGDAPTERIVKHYMKTFRIDQRWHMFRNAPRWSGWPEVLVRTNSGNQKDIWRLEWEGDDAPGPLGPDRAAVAFKNSLRWFLFQSKMSEQEKDEPDKLFYGYYVCRKWNEEHVDKAMSVQFRYHYTYYEIGKDPDKRPPKLVWTYECPSVAGRQQEILYKY